MRIAEYINGQVVYRDATAEELAEFEKAQQEAEAQKTEPTVEEEIAKLKADNIALSDMIDALLTEVLPSLIGE